MNPNSFRYCLIAGFAWIVLPGVAVSEDNEAGVPLSPAEAVGTWTVQTGGEAACVVKLGAAKAGDAGFSASTRGCAGTLPDGVAGWAPTGNGMALNAVNGQVLIAFDRWSNSLFVSHRRSGVDVQLMRGSPS